MPFSDEELKEMNEIYPDIDEMSSGMTQIEIDVHRRFLDTIDERDKQNARYKTALENTRSRIESGPGETLEGHQNMLILIFDVCDKALKGDSDVKR